MSDSQYRHLKALLLADVEDAAICDLTPMVLAQAIASLEANVLRGMDAIHIGSALALEAELFVTSDQRQLVAAQSCGLRAVSV